MHIEASQLELHELPNPIRVRDMQGVAIESITHHEASVLIARSLVMGTYYKKNTKPAEFRHLQLLVSRLAYRRALSGMMSTEQPQGVTRARQDRGGKHWIERLDKSDCGLTGTRRTIHLRT